MRIITPPLRKLIKEDAIFRKAFVIATRHNLPGLYPSIEDGRVWYADKDNVFLSVMNPCSVYCICKLLEVTEVQLDTRDEKHKQPPYIVMRSEQYRSIDKLCQKVEPSAHACYSQHAYDIKDVLNGFDAAYIRQFIAGKLNNETVFDDLDMTGRLVEAICPNEDVL